jgi:ABC-2 type transport system ATP-binding protein
LSKPRVKAEKVSKWYGKVVGINDFTVDIGPGVTGLLGPNGAGKSTFIKLLVGALRPSKGKLEVLGETVWGNRRLLGRIGYCPEHDGIYEDLTGREFVAAMARLGGLDRGEAQERADEALDRLGLTKARDRLLGEYSKGMRQRAKLAQTLVHDPELLLFDEPLTGCDPLARVQITDLIQELGKAGKTVIVSSHILHEIESMTSEIVLLYKGQVLAEGNIYRIREMIDEHPHQIRVECDEPRSLGQKLVTSEDIRAIEFPGDGALVVETHDPDGCYPLIPRVALESGIKIRSLTSPDNNLQAVFEYLTQERGPEGVARGGPPRGEIHAGNAKPEKAAQAQAVPRRVRQDDKGARA